jgi:putative DNA primase/helicase
MEDSTTPERGDETGAASLAADILGSLYQEQRTDDGTEPVEEAATPSFADARAEREGLQFLERPDASDTEGTALWGQQVRMVLENTARSDLGNAYRLLNIEGANLRYVHDTEHWIVRDEQLGHWAVDADGAQARQRWHDVASMMRLHAESAAATADDEGSKAHALMLKKFALKSQSKSSIDNAVNVAATLGPLRIPHEELDGDPMVLAVRNGVLDLAKRKLRGHGDIGYNTMVSGTEFLPGATCPEWERHVSVISAHADGTSDPDLAAYLQRWVGYSLTGLVSEQKFAFAFGAGSNGKNVSMETIMKIMGDYAMPGSAKILNGDAGEHETIIADLAGRRLVFIDEAPKGRVNDSRLKALTGTGRIRARKMRKDSFEFPARFKLWIAGNNKPRITDTSEGMWRRLDLIPFDAFIPPERRVRDYADILYREEGAGILNWALDGLMSYLEIGLAAPARVREATAEYREEETSDTAQFATDMFDVSADDSRYAWMPNKIIHGLYEEWCRENGVKYVLSTRMLGPELKKAGFKQDEKTRRVSFPLEGDKVARGWVCPPLAVSLPVHLAWSEKS